MSAQLTELHEEAYDLRLTVQRLTQLLHDVDDAPTRQELLAAGISANDSASNVGASVLTASSSLPWSVSPSLGYVLGDDRSAYRRRFGFTGTNGISVLDSLGSFMNGCLSGRSWGLLVAELTVGTRP